MEIVQQETVLAGRSPARRHRLISCVIAAAVAVSCSSTYKSRTVEEKRTYLDDLERETLAELVEKRPEVQADIDNSVGHGCRVSS